MSNNISQGIEDTIKDIAHEDPDSLDSLNELLNEIMAKMFRDEGWIITAEDVKMVGIIINSYDVDIISMCDYVTEHQDESRSYLCLVWDYINSTIADDSLCHGTKRDYHTIDSNN